MGTTIDVLRDPTRVMETLSPEQNETLDSWSKWLQGLIHTLVGQGGAAGTRTKNWLNGVWLGHPLHPALTDATLGAWSTGAMLDLVGERGAADAAMTVGVLSAVPTALSGAADWADAGGEQRRAGMLHALLNTLGLTCMVASLFARRADRRALGIGLSTIGLSLSAFAAWLGGEMVYALGTNVNRSAFQPTVDEFTPVMSADALEPGKLVGAEISVEGTTIPLVLLKQGQNIMALGATCTHWGGPLAEGTLINGDCVQCPWHATQFSMVDGRVLQGPGTVRAHSYETRINRGQVEVRRRG